MLRALLKFSEPGLQMGGGGTTTGSQLLDGLLTKAHQAAQQAFDMPTVEKTLVDSDWLLRITAVKHFGDPPADIGEWKHLLPQMEKLAVDDDASIRSAADRKLQRFPGTEKFLDERLTNETSAEVLMALLENRYVGEELKTRFLTLFVPLLSHRDEKVREDALLFVGSNSGNAPMWQFAFGIDVFDRVIASTQAKSAKERAAAAYALTDIRQLDADRSRETFLHLVNDPDEDVRWRVAGGLAGQYEREDVRQAIAVLLKDKSPGVRFMTILAVGPQKFIPELEELSKGSDPLIAGLATQKLNQLADDKRQ